LIAPYGVGLLAVWPPDYALVAPSYSEERAELTRKIGLGGLGNGRAAGGHRGKPGLSLRNLGRHGFTAEQPGA
jgi:hypothetical protein